jgi:hypothetical protein
MTIISDIQNAGDAYARLAEGLRLEFGGADIGALAERILEAEKADFHWESRIKERYLGQHLPIDFGDDDVSRIAILSFLGGRWHAGVCLVDGDGCAIDLLWLRSFEERDDASDAFSRAR